MSHAEEQSDRSASHVSSSVSIKSDNSKGVGTNFSEKTPSAAKSDRSASPVSSSVSMKSDNSKGVGTNFSEKTPSAAKRPNTSVNIGGEMTRWKTLKQQKGIKSDAELATYLLNRIQFETSDAGFQNDRFHKHVMDGLIWTFKDLENKIITFLKNELQRFKKILKKENTEYHVKDFQEDTQNVKAAALDITLHFLRSMNKKKLAHILQDELVFIHQRPLKLILKKKYERISEGIAKHGEFTLLSEVFTDLYITQGGDEQHEINQVQAASRHLESPDIQFKCTHLFKPPGQGQTIRTVLTKGVAGIGKSVSVQKFVLDWAEGRENNDISFIFPLPFREMNLKEKERLSLMDLIVQFFPEIKGVNLSRNDKLKVLFILDGLDECRLPLNFDGNEILRDITSPASLDVLLTNLIKGNLLPSAHIWITTRPAAASKIPPECIDLVTEVRGFNDLQKEEYFRKRFTDENMADTIIDHVKKSKSLFIMCHIPVFCWISATVLQNILEEKKMENSDDTTKTLQEELSNDDTPRTLTQMYTHFFRFQIQQSRRKYDGEYSPDISWDMESIYSLGKLAFEQLEINNLIFYKSDLEDCDIDVSKASVYSGMCTQIFKQETGIILGTVYCFVHMSIQEFIAALYAHLFLDKNKKFVFVQEHKEQENNDETMTGLLKTAVDKALESDNGHLDLFLRFLLGLSLESNRPLLRGLLSQEESNKQNNTEIVQYIKQKFEDNSCPERSINLFYCLNELNDQTLVQEVQKHLSEGSLSSSDLSPAQWSALAFVLLTSDEELEEFELQKFKKSDQCLIRLSPVVKTVKKALLSDCNLTDKSCPALANVLGSGSNLQEINMSNNSLQDSGVKLLCDGIMKQTNKKKSELEILRFSNCDLTEESCSALASALSLDSSSLKELDLSNNDLQDSGIERLSEGLKNNCKLQILSVSECSIGEEGYKSLCSAVRSNPSHLIDLDLRGNDPGETGVKLIYQLLQDHKCSLKTVRFLKSCAAEEACDYLCKALDVYPLLLKELNLSHNKLGDLDGEKLSALLMDSHNKVTKIILNNCELTENQCSALAAVLSCKTLVKEMNLNNSRLMDSGLKHICDKLKNPQCHLQILKFSNCDLTEESCSALASALSLDSSSLKDLDLSNNDLQDSGIERLSEGLKNNCKLQILSVSECSIGEEGYKSLSSAVRSNPSHLIDLDLRGNDPGETGVKLIYQLLQDHKCSLKTVRFLTSDAAVKAFEYLKKVLHKNPLLEREVNLSDHKLDESRVNQICDLLKDKHCRINTLILRDCGLTGESCSALASVLSSNTSLKELDVSNNHLQDSGVKKLQTGLENIHCQLQKLSVSECSIGEEGYKSLCSAVRSNPSHLIDLDLRGNDPGQTGVKLIYQLLQNSKCALETVRFLKRDAVLKAFEYLHIDFGINPSLQGEVDLSDHKLHSSTLKQICLLLEDKPSKLNKLM
ncbi:NACHT, LRR and PYD domains-containing protein 12-like isoform X3 [Triplophysa rosa]|uniref:NACHT, LRR and PYD domains-containing protein 12-like isoform X3 n=1 Tax=Triplophysa rosa TaxID=992332 RepID=UPI0025462925|nr:NACHT, LRR and PYD domains-containing protein 12-like isoform X3 [Triplophysa rosa]